MGWIYLLIAALLEVAWAIGLKFTGEWTRPIPSALVILAYGLCLVLLSAAVKTIPPSIAYSAWVGLGIVGVSTLDILVFREPATPLRLLCIAAILLGTIGLKAQH